MTTADNLVNVVIDALLTEIDARLDAEGYRMTEAEKTKLRSRFRQLRSPFVSGLEPLTHEWKFFTTTEVERIAKEILGL